MSVRTLLLILMCLVESIAFSQTRSASIKPRWMHQLPTPTNSTFRYEMLSAEAPTLDAARQNSLNRLVQGCGLRNGVVVVSGTSSQRKLNQHWVNGRLTETYDVSTNTSTDVQAQAQKLYVEQVAEYWERRNGNYMLTTVYAKSELGKAPLFDSVAVTSQYGARGLWRSMIIPGWGQIYKGSTIKGCVILGGTAVIAGAIVFAENQRSDYSRKIKGTHDIKIRKSYKTKRDHWATTRNVLIGAEAALYVYNIIDALIAPGAQRLVVHNYGRRGGYYSLMPSVDTNSAGFYASITF